MGKIFGGNFALEFLQSRKMTNFAFCCCYYWFRVSHETLTRTAPIYIDSRHTWEYTEQVWAKYLAEILRQNFYNLEKLQIWHFVVVIIGFESPMKL